MLIRHIKSVISWHNLGSTNHDYFHESSLNQFKIYLNGHCRVYHSDLTICLLFYRFSFGWFVPGSLFTIKPNLYSKWHQDIEHTICRSLESDSCRTVLKPDVKFVQEIKFNWLNDKSMNQRNQGYIGYKKWTKSKFKKLV